MAKLHGWYQNFVTADRIALKSKIFNLWVPKLQNLPEKNLFGEHKIVRRAVMQWRVVAEKGIILT